MPALGQTVEEVRILRWLKDVGDAVERGEPLAEIETDKVSMEWESPAAGVIEQILAAADTYVPVEAPVILLADAATNGRNDAADTALPGRIAVSPRARRTADELGIDTADLAGRGTGPDGRVIERDVIAYQEELQAISAVAAIAGRGPKASPLARAMAADLGHDLGSLTDPGRRITAADIPTTTEPVRTGATHVTVLTGLRKRAADTVARSIREAPHVTLHLSVNMTEAVRLRERLLPEIERSTGVRLSYTDLIIRVCAAALRQHPAVNAHRDGDTITRFGDAHIGLAVSLGEDGLIVPVIQNAGSKGLAEIAKARHGLVERARGHRLDAVDVAGGTFTITNLGGYGIAHFDPIIVPPQVAILGVGAIADTVVPWNGTPAIRPVLPLSLSFDHRAMDGAPAAAFLACIKDILETPALLLL